MINTFIRYLKNIFRKDFNQSVPDINYQIENYSIILPSDHKLPEYQRNYKNYDKKLKQIITSTNDNEVKNIVIDIGANVGDSAAYIRSFTNSKIYCIEGDLYYLNYLKKNVNTVPNVTIIDSYVEGRTSLANYEVIRSNGTARLELLSGNISKHNGKIKSLINIFEEYKIDPVSIQLIKTDTDGYDFDILLANENLIKKNKPPLYFEYDISFNASDENNSIELVKLLETQGYKFIVYDNFGNLMTVIFEDAINRFLQLNHYVKSCRKFGGGIYYYDIFASINLQTIISIAKNDLKC